MAIIVNSNIPTNQSVGGVVNPKKGVNDVARQDQTVETQPKRIPEIPESQRVRTDEKAIRALDAEREQAQQQAQNRTTHDNPDRATTQALNLYKSVANAERKEEIHSLLGVDLFV